MKNRTFSTIVIVLLFTLAFLLLFRACAGAIEGNLDGGNAEADELEAGNETAGASPRPTENIIPLICLYFMNPPKEKNNDQSSSQH